MTNRTLPYGGGTYNSVVPKTGGVTTPMFSGAPAVGNIKNYETPFLQSQTSNPNSPLNQFMNNPEATIPTAANPVFTGGQTSAPAAPSAPTVRSKYINPATGQDYATPEEYANAMAQRIPVSKATGDVGQYAGDALTNPNAGTANLTSQATNLNNARNDIATGTTDPYKVGNKSGIAYSPAELKAIENAYAGVYDPAIKDVFIRLAEQKKKDDQEDAKKMEIFRTDENIRQYNATTGINSGGKSLASLGLTRGADGYVPTADYLKKAVEWESSGKSMSDFIKSYPPEAYVNPNDVDALPSYLKPSTANMSERTAEVWKELSRPEVQALSDEEKATVIRRDYGLDPQKFGIYTY